MYQNSTLESIYMLSDEEIHQRIKAISVDDLSSEQNLNKAMELLKSEGIVVIPNYLPQAVLESAEHAIQQIEQHLEQHSSKPLFEDDNIILQNGQSIANGYDELASHSKVIATVRQGQDQGMVDVFNIDRLEIQSSDSTRSYFEKSKLSHILSDSKGAPLLKNINLYLNRSITSTRGFHADTYSKKLKAFVYLSDVTQLSDGPYCFVRKSSNEGPWRTANQQLAKILPNKTEAPFINIADAVPILAPKGSLVISDQSGFHRGIPQSENSIRKVIVASYQ